MDKWEQVANNTLLPAAGQKVFIWGAGNTAVLAHQGMLRENLYVELGVIGFIDSNRAGTLFVGFNVYPPSILNNIQSNSVFVLICTTNPIVFNEIKTLCDEKKIPSCSLDAAIVRVRMHKFHNVFSLLDNTSREIYSQILINRMCVQEIYSQLYAGESYFGIPYFCKSNTNDVIIDCGAYVGDSAERYIWRMEQFNMYIAIEPDAGNYIALTKRIHRLNTEWNYPEGKLVGVHAGVDAVSHKLSIETRVSGLGSIATTDATSNYVQFWALDDYITERYTFLKADIESYEYRMLLGARRGIDEFHPRMAICIYHNMIDMYSIPQLIYSINSSYQLAIRHHSYGYEETVLYAW